MLRLRVEVVAPLWRWWAVAIGVVMVPMLPLMVGATSGMNDDDLHLFGPMYQWVWKRWLSGHTPWWTPSMFAGHNLAGAGQSAWLYVPNAVFAVFDVVVAYRWWVVAHLVVGATGMFLWSWRSWRSKPGAAVSAIAYGLNGFAILHLVHMSFTIATAWAPWFFIGLDLLIDRWSVKRALVVVVPLAVIASCTHPQLFWLVLVGGGVYTVVRLAGRGGVWPWVRVGGAVAAGLAVSAVCLIPLWLFSRTSVRPSLTQANAFYLASEPRDLLTLVFPHIMGGGDGLLGLSGPWQGGRIYHEVGNHIGIVTLALAVIAVVFLGRNRRVLAIGIVAVFALLTSLGASTPVGRITYEFVPLADHFRVWSRNQMLFDLAAALLAGAGVGVVLSARATRRWRILLGFLIGVGLLVNIGLISDLGGARVTGRDLGVLLIYALVCVIPFGCALLLDGERRLAAILIVTAVGLNMAVFAAAAPWTRPLKSVDEATAFFDQSIPTPIEPYRAPGGISRVMTDNTLYAGAEFIHKVPLINGYDPLIQKDFQYLTGADYFGYLTDSRFWSPGWYADVLRVTTFIASPGQRPDRAGWTNVGTLPTRYVRWERTPRLAEAYVVGAVEFASLDTIKQRLSSDSSNFTTKVLLDDNAQVRREFAGRDSESTPGVVLEGSVSNVATAHYRVSASAPGVLVMSIGAENGWSATVNGHAVPVARANGLVLAVPVQAGLNEVELTFTTPGLHLGMAISLAAWVTLIALAAIPTIRRRLATRHDRADRVLT